MLFFFLLTCATWYYHDIYIVFTYIASFTGYEDDIFEVIIIYTFKDLNLAENFTNLAEKLNSAEFMEFAFSKSGQVFQKNARPINWPWPPGKFLMDQSHAACSMRKTFSEEA